jgi:hypothetical protein
MGAASPASTPARFSSPAATPGLFFPAAVAEYDVVAVEVLRVSPQLSFQGSKFGGLRHVACGRSTENGRTDDHGAGRGCARGSTTTYLLHLRSPSPGQGRVCGSWPLNVRPGTFERPG